MPGQVMLTFDDGIAVHRHAADELNRRSMSGVFGVVTSKVGTPGFLDWGRLDLMQGQGHVICNHSHEHKWSGLGSEKPGKRFCGWNEITEDYINAQDILNCNGFSGDYLIVPYGTGNMAGADYLNKLFDRGFQWFRMTVGGPVGERGWFWGNDNRDDNRESEKHLLPRNHSGRIVGVSAAASVYDKFAVIETCKKAAAKNALAIICYHSVGDVTGSGQNIEWPQFLRDLGVMEQLDMECVRPGDLICDTV